MLCLEESGGCRNLQLNSVELLRSAPAIGMFVQHGGDIRRQLC